MKRPVPMLKSGTLLMTLWWLASRSAGTYLSKMCDKFSHHYPQSSVQWRCGASAVFQVDRICLPFVASSVADDFDSWDEWQSFQGGTRNGFWELADNNGAGRSRPEKWSFGMVGTREREAFARSEGMEKELHSQDAVDAPRNAETSLPMPSCGSDICCDFLEGRCSLGEDCCWSHSIPSSSDAECCYGAACRVGHGAGRKRPCGQTEPEMDTAPDRDDTAECWEDLSQGDAAVASPRQAQCDGWSDGEPQSSSPTAASSLICESGGNPNERKEHPATPCSVARGSSEYGDPMCQDGVSTH